MARKITMRGDQAQYIERRAKDMPDDDREIVMEGEHARYREYADVETAKVKAAAAGIAIPDMLATAVAQNYWQRLREAGFVDENCMLLQTTTRQQTWYIAELFAEKLQLVGVKWKPFQDLWNIRNLAQEKKHAQDTGLLPTRHEDIDAVFQD